MRSTLVFSHAARLARSCSATMQSYQLASMNNITQQPTNTNPRSAARVLRSTHPMHTDALTCTSLPNDKHSPQHGSIRNIRNAWAKTDTDYTGKICMRGCGLYVMPCTSHAFICVDVLGICSHMSTCVHFRIYIETSYIRVCVAHA